MPIEKKNNPKQQASFVFALIVPTLNFSATTGFDINSANAQ